MIVHKKSKHLILSLKNPERVTDVIPGAKLLRKNGANFVVVPHREDEVRVLRNLGFDPPTPIETYYGWPCGFENGPMSHQRLTAAFMAVHPRAYILNGMGSGKTLAALWAFDYLRATKQAKRMLVVAPLSTLQRTWADEIFGHLGHLTFGMLHGPMARRLAILEEPFDVYIVNHDGMKAPALLEALLKRDDIDVVCIDELAVFRTKGTVRFKAMVNLVKGRKFAWGMTGTPTPNAPTDAWAQCRILTPHTVPPAFVSFQNMAMRQVTQYKWAPKADATATVARVMQPAIRFSREECVDLPPTTHVTRTAPLTPEQSKALDEMIKKMKMEYDGGSVTAVNEAVKLGKLAQICCGVAYGPKGEHVSLPCSPRVELVREIIEEAEAKVIVFVPFTGALLMLADELRKSFSVETVYGGVSKGERDRIFLDFQRSEHPRVLVADARTMSHGLSLTAANTTIWYGPTNSNETYMQANERTPRPGQKLQTLIVHIESHRVETAMYARLKSRGTMQGALLQLLKEM